MEQQLRGIPRVRFDDFCTGMLRFMLGMSKKTLLADTLANGADMIFRDPVPGFGEAWWGVLFFTFQIYFDFSGYSDIAIGSAYLLGIRLPRNFATPFLASSIAELWQRWQVGLQCRITLPQELPPLRLLVVMDNLAGHRTPGLVLWMFAHGIMPLYTPLSWSWLNMAESIQRILKRRALEGQHPQTPEEIIALLEATTRGWNQAPTPFVWGGKRALRRARSRERRHRLVVRPRSDFHFRMKNSGLGGRLVHFRLILSDQSKRGQRRGRHSEKYRSQLVPPF